VKGRYERRRLGRRGSFDGRFWGMDFFGLSWICREELSSGVGRFSTGALVC
jgi:hypothetical protein